MSGPAVSYGGGVCTLEDDPSLSADGLEWEAEWCNAGGLGSPWMSGPAGNPGLGLCTDGDPRGK